MLAYSGPKPGFTKVSSSMKEPTASCRTFAVTLNVSLEARGGSPIQRTVRNGDSTLVNRLRGTETPTTPENKDPHPTLALAG